MNPVPHRLSSARRRVVSEMVLVMTPSFPMLEAPVRIRVHSSVTAFVTSQIEALSPFMGVPYRLAITGFNLLAVCRFGRVFTSLDEASKQVYVALWSDAPIAVCRDFIKLIRSCAMLSFYDHPDVSARLPGAMGRRDVG